MQKLAVSLIVLPVLVGLGACAGKSAPPPADAPRDAVFTDQYRIGIGDALSINVWRNPELSVQVPVRPDGKISVPLANDVEVGNKTPEEVAAVVAERLSQYIRDPYVTVIVTGMGSDEFLSRVRVTGAVNAPSSRPYRHGMTVLDVILDSGGLSEFANPTRAILYRQTGERIKINLRKILNRGDLSGNYTLLPGDVLTVPERAF